MRNEWWIRRRRLALGYSKLTCLALGGYQKMTKTSRKSLSLSEIRPRGLPDIIQKRCHVGQLKQFLTDITQRHRKNFSIKCRSYRRCVHYQALYVIHFSSPFLSAWSWCNLYSCLMAAAVVLTWLVVAAVVTGFSIRRKARGSEVLYTVPLIDGWASCNPTREYAYIHTLFFHFVTSLFWLNFPLF